MFSKTVRFMIAAAMLFVVLTGTLRAQTSYCIEQFGKDASLSIAPSEVSDLVRSVADSIGVRLSVITVPCRYEDKANAIEYDGKTSGIPAGQYVVYNPDWVREVIGSDRFQAIALFGHEFGHLVNQHFSLRSNIPRLQKETEADEFAGCSVARLGGTWETLSGLLSRLRREKADPRYPDRLTSLDAARRGFQNCGGIVSPETRASSADCNDLPAGGLNIRLVPRLGNFGPEEFDRLRQLLNCEKYRFSMGNASLFPGQAMNSIAYSGALDFRIVIKILESLRKLNAQPDFICSGVNQIKDDYVLLVHHNNQILEDRPYTNEEFNRLVKATSKAEFESNLRTHTCTGRWSIAGPAAR